ncbi:MAG: hypothetical protein K5841_01815 [Fretibacterium sp.]|nr:hypothetical protein [Fretibacterium sp.]
MALVFSLFASLFLGEMLSRLWWAQEAAVVEERRLRNGTVLASLTARGRHWLQTEIEAGRLPRKIRAVPANFEKVRIHHYHGDAGMLEVYNLDYDSSKVTDKDWGPAGFFPPRAGAFLIRASVTEGGMERRIETVVALREPESGDAALEERPLLWQEVWP